MIRNIIIYTEDMLSARYVESEIKDALPCDYNTVIHLFLPSDADDHKFYDTLFDVNLQKNTLLIADIDSLLKKDGRTVRKLFKDCERRNLPALLFGVKERVEYLSVGGSADIYSGAIFLQYPFSAKLFRSAIYGLIKSPDPLVEKTTDDVKLIIDSEHMILRFNKSSISLTEKEYSLFIYLLEHRSSAVSRKELLEQVWGLTEAKGSNIVDVYINYLRSKLKSLDAAVSIDTVRGIGYILKIS